MKPIPKELQTYFPKAVDPMRPWWECVPDPTVPPDRFPSGWHGKVWRRLRDVCSYGSVCAAERAHIDTTGPLPPPPVLVGQVWAYSTQFEPDTMRIVQLHRIILRPARDAAVFNPDDGFVATGPNLIARGFLLTCPFGYAPWSGPEVP